MLPCADDFDPILWLHELMFTPYPKELINGHPKSDDSDDIRLGAYVRCVEESYQEVLSLIQPSDFVVFGYADDRGVTRNGGRSGAAEAPNVIRSYLYSMTPSAFNTRPAVIWDFGNFKTWSMDLLEAQEEARKVIAEIRSRNPFIISLGGGHDWAYSDFCDWSEGPIFNLDAHSDMRPNPTDVQMAGHSGTPFRRILEKSRGKVPVYAVGLQTHCNARAHLKWAEGYQCLTLFYEEMPPSFDAQWKLIEDRFQIKPSIEKMALSIDMDAFPQSISPGVSAPQSFGISPHLAQRLMNKYVGKFKHLGVYEANPRLDYDGATSRLAAKLIHHYLQQGS